MCNGIPFTISNIFTSGIRTRDRSISRPALNLLSNWVSSADKEYIEWYFGYEEDHQGPVVKGIVNLTKSLVSFFVKSSSSNKIKTDHIFLLKNCEELVQCKVPYIFFGEIVRFLYITIYVCIFNFVN